VGGRHTGVIIEADGGSRGNPGPAGFGSVLKDAETGEVIAEAAESIGHATNNVAEYRGLIAGLELYADYTPEAQLEVRMDSKLVIEQMAGRWRIKHPDMRPLALTAQRLAPFGTVWTWVPREQNKHADRLANLAMDAAARGEVYVVGPPPRGHESPPRGQESEPRGQESPPRGHESPARGHESDPRGQDSGHASGVNAPGDPTPEAPEPPANTPLIGWLSRFDDVTTMILLRHGVTRFTIDKRFSGPGGPVDPGLTDEGRDQAERAARVIKADGGVDVILASPLRRTLETAEPVADALSMPVQTVPDFRECAFGDWDGLTFEEVLARWPAELETWLGSVTERPPGGESLVDVQTRVEQALKRVLDEHHGGTVLVVSHVTPIKLAVRYCLDIPLESINRLQLAPASLTTLSFYGSGASTLRQFSAIP
jgi:probable phosphoglycerate mutase